MCLTWLAAIAPRVVSVGAAQPDRSEEHTMNARYHIEEMIGPDRDAANQWELYGTAENFADALHEARRWAFYNGSGPVDGDWEIGPGLYWYGNPSDAKTDDDVAFIRIIEVDESVPVLALASNDELRGLLVGMGVPLSAEMTAPTPAVASALLCENGHDGPFQLTRFPIHSYEIETATTACMAVRRCDEVEVDCTAPTEFQCLVCGVVVDYNEVAVDWVGW
jgi:hypothetical protein